MIVHTIFIGSSYESGKRIALHRPELSSKESSELYEVIQSNCSAVPISTHYIVTKSPEWASVVEKDPFFKDVEVTPYVEEYMKKITSVKTLIGLDVAKYILSKIKKCTHLQLQKLTYLSFAEYLETSNDLLFDDKIYAFELGPVVDSVYSVFKRKRDIDIDEISATRDSDDSDASRILYSFQGSDKLAAIERTLDKYSSFSAPDLVNITHKKDSPWSKVYDGESFKEIPKDIIKKYHKYEKIV